MRVGVDFDPLTIFFEVDRVRVQAGLELAGLGAREGPGRSRPLLNQFFVGGPRLNRRRRLERFDRIRLGRGIGDIRGQDQGRCAFGEGLR